MARKLLISGIAYTPEYKEDYHGSWFGITEMNDDLARQCIGLPALINHDLSHPPVGKIIDAMITESGQLSVVIECDVEFFNDMLVSNLTSDNKLGKPVFTGLSLGTKVGEKRSQYDVEIVSKVPEEVSIVPVGDRPHTYITGFVTI